MCQRLHVESHSRDAVICSVNIPSLGAVPSIAFRAPEGTLRVPRADFRTHRKQWTKPLQQEVTVRHSPKPTMLVAVEAAESLCLLTVLRRSQPTAKDLDRLDNCVGHSNRRIGPTLPEEYRRSSGAVQRSRRFVLSGVLSSTKTRFSFCSCSSGSKTTRTLAAITRQPSRLGGPCRPNQRAAQAYRSPPSPFCSALRSIETIPPSASGEL